MLTRIEPADLGLQEAAELIRRGDLVAFPTETVYGLGADAGNASAIEKIYQVKGRPANNPLIVHVPDVAAAQSYSAGLTPLAVAFAQAFWPGPLTLVLPRNDRICPEVSAGKNTVAIRCPRNPVAQELLRTAGRPIAAPSANRSGHTSPTTAQHVYDELAGHIALILDGGPCGVGLESTVVDVTGTTPAILRPGAVTQAMLARCLGAAGFSTPVTVLTRHAGNSTNEPLDSPGQLESHYAPRTAAYRFYASDLPRLNAYLPAMRNRRIGMLCLEGFAAPAGLAKLLVLPAAEQACARVLYGALRELDTAGYDVLLIQCPENSVGVWAAIEDRLRRATKELPR